MYFNKSNLNIIHHSLKVSNYRSISYCSAIYKCISKVLDNSLRICLSSLTSLNQSAFVEGRRIGDDIYLLRSSEGLS